MAIHPLHTLCEGDTVPLVSQTDTKEHEGRLWHWMKNAFQWSRRYSIVATEVSLLALNVVFLVAKADEDAPEKLGEVTLALLSTIGVLSLHYYIDVVWKSLQDTSFAYRQQSVPITLLAAAKTAQVANNVALTFGNFVAAMQGVTGDVEGQTLSYQRMILWGEVSLGIGLGITLLSLLATWKTKKKIESGELERDPQAIAFVRFSMDKDTLWHLIDKLKRMDPQEQEELTQVVEVVKKNIDTQIKVTMGGNLVLILAGDVLQAIEKAYTPNSLVSAAINCGVSVAYAAKISIEKGIEYFQRKKLDELNEETDEYELVPITEI